MNAKTRRKLEMGARALVFSQEHPDPGPGSAESFTRLEQLVARGTHLARHQLAGLIEVHATAVTKRDLCRTIRSVHLAHLRHVARIAARDLPGLRFKFVLQRGTIPYEYLRIQGRRMLAEARSRREVLVTYGLSDTVLESLAQALEQLEDAMRRGRQARLAHVSASVELDVVAQDIVQTVRAMDGINRIRFAKSTELLAAWETASHVAAAPREGGAEKAA
jgi:hypothetical protein